MTRAAFWSGGIPLDLNDVVFDANGWTLEQALAINDRDQILVVARRDDQPHVVDGHGIDRPAAVIDVRAQDVDPAGRADHEDFSVRPVNLTERPQRTDAHACRLLVQVRPAGADSPQCLIESAIRGFCGPDPLSYRMQHNPPWH